MHGSTVAAPGPRTDSPLATTVGWPSKTPIGVVRGRPFPRIANYLLADISTTGISQRLPERRVYCPGHYAAHHPRRQRAGTGVFACGQQRRPDRRPCTDNSVLAEPENDKAVMCV